MKELCYERTVVVWFKRPKAPQWREEIVRVSECNGYVSMNQKERYGHLGSKEKDRELSGIPVFLGANLNDHEKIPCSLNWTRRAF